MRKRLIVVGLVLLFLVSPAILVAQTYLVDRYSNNAGPGTTMDPGLSLINVARGGSPVTSAVGDVCANIYVFDANQEMISCCYCRLTPNALATASVGNELTNNPLTSVIPNAGVIKILPTAAGAAVCNPAARSAPSDASLVMGFATHLETSTAATFITETNIPIAPLGSDEAAFLPNACLFVTYLGSGYGKGTCSCTGGTVNSGTATYSISGTISGAGGSAATVNLTGAATAAVTADASGNYSFPPMPSGSYTVTPSNAGFTFTPASQPAIVNNANVTGVNFSTATYSIYKAFIQPPLNAGGISAFSAKRGVIPLKFTLTQNDIPTCTLPPASIAVTRTSGGTVGSVGVSIYSTPADNGSNFRIDATSCQYIYNLAASSLGFGTYRVDINIGGIAVGHVVFALE